MSEMQSDLRAKLYGVRGSAPSFAPELMLRAKDIASSSFRPMHLFVLAAILYFIMSYPLSIVARRLEARLARER